MVMPPSPEPRGSHSEELYGIAWKDAYNILLSEQKANRETKCLV